MFAKIFGVTLMVLCVGAAPQHRHATSYATISRNVGHQQSGQESRQSIGQGYSSSLGSGLGSYQTLSFGHGQQAIQAAPVLLKSAQQEEDHYDAHPQYEFKYAVEDRHTGDIKSHQETRDGDVVKGSYSVNQPDGTVLTVEYTADKHSGFNAVVHRTGKANYPAQQAKASAAGQSYQHY